MGALGEVFLRFLLLGLRAWGGPVAQLGLMHQELVERARWVDEATFRRVLGVYQVLPGPEATEMAVYLGIVRAGRRGGLLAGLGFILPGFLLTMAAAVVYAAYGRSLPGVTGLFYAAQPAVVGLLFWALIRLSRMAFTTRGLLLTGIATFGAATATGVNLVLIALLFGGLYYAARARPGARTGALLAAGWLAGALPPALSFFWFFLLAGSVTFGGAYTVLPFLEQGAVHDFGWLSPEQFVDAVAVGGLIPAPLIMVAAFVGHLAAPPWGGPLATLAIFLPAFVLTLGFHERLLRLVANENAQHFLDGITAAVVGLIGVTLVAIAPVAVPDAPSALLAVVAFVTLWAWRTNPALVVLSAMVLGVGLEAFGALPP